MTLIRSKVKVTRLLNFRKLAKPCMHAGGDDRQPPCGPAGLSGCRFRALAYITLDTLGVVFFINNVYDLNQSINQSVLYYKLTYRN